MSISPGTTGKFEQSIIISPFSGLISSATSTIVSPIIAISLTSSMSFLGSTTLPCFKIVLPESFLLANGSINFPFLYVGTISRYFILSCFIMHTSIYIFINI